METPQQPIEVMDEDRHSKLKIVLRDEIGSLISTLNAIHDYGYDYREVHCTQRVDGSFDLLVHIAPASQQSKPISVLCTPLEKLGQVVELGQVGQRLNAQRAG